MNLPHDDRLKVIKLDDQLASVGVPWVVATYQPQPYAFANDEQAVILAAPGSIFAVTADHTITVKEGSVVVSTAKHDVQIITPSGTVTIAANSAAGVSQERFGPVHVASLVGEAASIQLKGVETPLTVATNTETSVVSNKVALMGVGDFVPVFNKNAADGVSTFKQSNRSLDLGKTPFTNAMTCVDRSDMSPGMKGAMTSLIAGMKNSGHKLPEGCIERIHGINAGGISISPIAYVENLSAPAPAEHSKKMTVTSVPGSRIVHGPLANFLDTADGIVLNGGEILVEADKSTDIKVNNYTIGLKPGTVALVSFNHKRVKIHNLCENNLEAMTVDNGKNSVSVSAGQELILSCGIGSTPSELSAEMKSDGIARRRVHLLEAKFGSTGAISEYSVVSLAASNKCVKHVMLSHEAADKAIKERVLKMAACLMHVTGSRGAYQQVASAGSDM